MFLIVLALRPEGLFPQGDRGMSDCRVACAPRSSRLGTPIVGVALIALAAAPCWARARTAAARRDLRLLALASLWNLLAGYGGLVSVGQQAFVGLGAYVLFALAILAACIRCCRDPARGVAAALVACRSPR